MSSNGTTNEPGSRYRDHLGSLVSRHDAALETCGYDGVAIHAGSPHTVFLDDQSYPFRVNPHFSHWIPGLADPESLIVYEPGRKPRLLHFRPSDFWHKVPDEPAGPWVEHFEVVAVHELSEIPRLLGESISRTAFIGESTGRGTEWGFQQLNPKALIDRLHYARSIKTDYELSCIQQANTRAVAGHRAAEKAFGERATALTIHLAYLEAIRQAESELPYHSIVALNENCAILHYQFIDRDPPADGVWHSLLIDAGATHCAYAADITRTYGAAGGEFQSLIVALERGQLGLCQGVRPGREFRELQSETHRLVAAILAEMGIVRLDPEVLVEEGITRFFFPHGLGHFLGLQVHDVGGTLISPEGATAPPPDSDPFLRLTRRLEPRQVLTIEPGIYFIDSLLERLRASSAARHVDWRLVERLRPCGGVRIEDNVAVTESAHRNFTREAFAEG